MSDSLPTLWHIEISHFSEKARWALAWKGVEHRRRSPLPGTHIPIHPPGRLAQTRPDYILILPWNLREEISAQLSYVRDWGGRLVVPIPALELI